MIKLYLLKGGFVNEKINPDQKYFCADCATIEGILEYFPAIKKELEIIYVDYEKPRAPIVELIGEENQSCPVIIFDDKSFINGVEEIVVFFYKKCNISQLHTIPEQLRL